MSDTLVEHLPRLSPRRRGTRPAGDRKPENRKINTAETSWVRYAAFGDAAKLIVEVLRTHDRKATGAPRLYDDFGMAVIFLLHGKMSTRKITRSLLIQPEVWDLVRQAYCYHYGRDAPWQMDSAPTRRQWIYFRDRRLVPLVSEVHYALRARAKDIALGVGMLDVNSPRLFLKPDRAHTVYGDGTVFRPVMRAPDNPKAKALTAQVADLGVTWCTEGGDEKRSFWGNAYTSVNIRLDDTAERRLTVDVRPLREKGSGGEAALGVNMVCDFHDLLGPDGRIDAALWDGAWRGTHASKIMRHTGALPVHRVRADEKAISLSQIKDCPCGSVHQLFTDQQTICTRSVDGEGNEHYNPVPNHKVLRRGRPGMYRVYLEFDLPCGKTHTVRIDQEKNDSGVNIAERVQPIAPHQPGWPYHWRADAETRHSELDRRMDWKRMPYYRPVNQDLFMIAEAMIGNERTYGEWLTRRAESAERAAS